ncbi:MAG TPA: DivIVA domain-containing protein [Gemmatimonadaceae bacterium]|nr:DivIVA domain-containing protein [Gemmatimonadaceae bacterium]
MSDESFHLTPLDIRRFDFGSRAFRGYDAQKVEDFRNQVADELERLTKLNQELDQKARGFHEQLRAFRERDKALNDALVSAQQLRAEMKEQADKEAQLILREARAEADRMMDAAKSEIRRLEGELAALDKSRVTYIAQLRAVIERQLAELSAMGTPPGAGRASGAAAAPPPPPPAAPPAPPRRASGEAEAAADPRAQMKTPAWLESLVKE